MNGGIDISVGQIDALLSGGNEAFLAEKDQRLTTGLASAAPSRRSWQNVRESLFDSLLESLQNFQKPLRRRDGELQPL